MHFLALVYPPPGQSEKIAGNDKYICHSTIDVDVNESVKQSSKLAPFFSEI